MASKYDEYERSLTGKVDRGLSPLGWVLAAVLGVFVLGGVAFAAVAAIAVNEARNTVVEFVGEEDAPTVVRIEEMRELRHQLRHELRHADRERVRAAAEVARALAAAQVTEDVMRELEDSFEGSLTFSIDGETISLDMFGDEDGAVFTMDLGDETYSVKIEGEDEGARLILSTPEGESVFEAGETAEAAPGWVPRYPGSSHPDRVFSGETSGKSGGADLSVTDDAPLEVVQHFTDALEAQGFEVMVERLSLGHSEVQGSIVGKRESDGKSVAVVVVEEHGETKVLTLWGDAIDL